MSILSFFTGGVKPIADLVDNLHTSKEEKLELNNALVKMELDMGAKLLEYEGKIAEAKSSVIIAEAQGESWIQRSWRPMIMLLFGFIVAWNWVIHPIMDVWFELPTLTTPDLPQGLWTTIHLGLGGYIAGRSGEKIIKSWNK
jgi:hypothetical protein